MGVQETHGRVYWEHGPMVTRDPLGRMTTHKMFMV